MPYAKYIKKHWKGFVVALIFLTLEAVADLMMPTILALIIDVGIANNDLDYVTRMGGFMLLIALGGAVAASLRNILAVLVSQKFGAELRSDLYTKIQHMSFENIDTFNRGSLITRMTNDITIVQNFVGGMMRIFVKAPLVGIGALILAVRLNPDLSVVFVVVVPVVAILVAMNMKIGFKRFMRMQESLDKVNSRVREYLSGVRVVKAFNRFGFEVDKFGQTNEEQRDRATSALRTIATFQPMIMFAVNMGIVAIIWIGGNWIYSGQMNETGEIVAFINYMTQILFALMMVSMVFNMFIRARASNQRISEVFKQKNMMNWQKDQLPGAQDRGSIQFENVTFSYANTSGPPVLKNVSFTCKPGETIGIIGSTGSGKSSLVHLIPRFYDTVSGVVRIDGVDVKEVDPASLREHIAIVPQQSTLFTGTIKENILWGNEKATMDDVIHAAQMAQADEFIQKLPEGYDTMIGQRGVNLSGGQKQRISIARALIRKPSILILDDCTSAVDTATESKIKAALKKYTENTTCLLIAQSIASVLDADHIIVMDLGEIVGVGTHDTLLRDCRVYQEIFQSQFGKEVRSNV